MYSDYKLNPLQGAPQPSRLQNNYFIGTYENRPNATFTPGGTQGDGPAGTMTSDVFAVEGNAISFLLGGGCNIHDEYVELLIDGFSVMKTTGKVCFFVGSNRIQCFSI